MIQGEVQDPQEDPFPMKIKQELVPLFSLKINISSHTRSIKSKRFSPVVQDEGKPSKDLKRHHAMWNY